MASYLLGENALCCSICREERYEAILSTTRGISKFKGKQVLLVRLYNSWHSFSNILNLITQNSSDEVSISNEFTDKPITLI